MTLAFARPLVRALGAVNAAAGVYLFAPADWRPTLLSAAAGAAAFAAGRRLERLTSGWELAGLGYAHSEKPERVRALVERVSPGPYLELFGRRAVHGWTVFGDQVSRGLFDADVVDLDDGDDVDEAPPPGAAGVTPAAKARPPLSVPPEPGYVSVGDLARRLGVSRSNVYALVAAGHLPHIRVGVGRGTIRIPAEAAADYERRVKRDDAASWSGHFA